MTESLRDFNVWRVTPEGTLWQHGTMRSKSAAKLRASLEWRWRGKVEWQDIVIVPSEQDDGRYRHGAKNEVRSD